MPRILITGTTRGIGLALAHLYAQDAANQVFATYRSENAELNTLAAQHPNLTLLPLDVADEAQIAAFPALIQPHADALDIIIHNAGINPRHPEMKALGTLTGAGVQAVIHTNAIGPLLLTQALLPLLTKGEQPRVVMVSSQMGSLGWKQGGGSYAYSMSKAAMNMAARTLAADLRPLGVTVITLHPGWVKTDMGGPGGEMLPEESAHSLHTLVAGLTLADSGSFFKWDGTPHVW